MPEPSAAAAMDAALARVAAEDERWHAMLALAPDARAAAARADATAPSGPLHAMILAIKDNIDVAGMATSSGCRAMAGALPRADAPVIARLRAAGALFLGKANLSEFSFEVRSRSSLGGDVLSPFVPGATAGGSSGGVAVAVARGFAMAGIATDTGGSIRIPAACNGLVGLRPAHGALPLDGIAPLSPSTDTVGPIALTVDHAERLYRAMGGTLAPRTAGAPRIGVLRQFFGQDPRVIAACEAGLARLAARGVALVDPFALPGIEALLAGEHIVDAEFAAAFDAYLASNFQPGTAPASLAAILEGGAFLEDHRPAIVARLAHDGASAPAILARHRTLTRAIERAMADAQVDLLAYATLQVIPEGLGNPKVGWAPELAPRTRWPALSVPAPVPAGSPPVGLELMAPTGQETLLFDLARLVEEPEAG